MTRRLLDQALERLPAYATIPCVEPVESYELSRHRGLEFATSGPFTYPTDIEGAGGDNLVVIGFGAETHKMRTIRIEGHGNIVYFGPHSRVSFLTMTIRGDNNFVYIGAFASANQIVVTRYGSGTTTAIGDRSMLSNLILIGRPDPVGFFTEADGLPMDQAQDILLGEYCWIGRNVVVEPGTTVGAHSVAAQSAVLSGAYPGNSILVGIPAVVRRKGTAWSRTNEETLQATLSSKHAQHLFLRPLARLQDRIAGLAAVRAGAAALSDGRAAPSAATDAASSPTQTE